MVKQSLLWYFWTEIIDLTIAAQAKYFLFLIKQKIPPLFHLFFSLSRPSLLSFPFFFCLIPPGQQEDEEDAGGGAASEERSGEDRQESSEEHERPDLGRD